MKLSKILLFGDYFLLLENRGSFALIRSDSAYNIKWSTTIETNFSIFPPTMKNVETDMLVYYSAGFGPHGSHNVHFVSVNETGNVNWHRTFGVRGMKKFIRCVISSLWGIISLEVPETGMGRIPIQKLKVM